MTDLTNAPAWVREIADRADEATRGPWAVIEAPALNGLTSIDVTSLPRGYVAGGDVVPRAVAQARRDMEFIAHARTDIPRLIEAAAGMAEVLEEQLRDDYTDCYGGVAMMAVDCVTCQLRDDCGRSRVLKALAKWRGEAGE